MSDTRLPLRLAADDTQTIVAADGSVVAYTEHIGVGVEQADSLAVLIVRAVNAHDDMLEALERLYRNGQKQGWTDGYEADMSKASAAIAKAKGGAP